MDCSLPGSSVHGILQAGILAWVAIPFSRGSSRPRDQTQVSLIAGRFFTVWAIREALVQELLLSHLSRVWLCATPSLGFPRQEHWSVLPFPSPGHKSEKWKWSRTVMSDSSRLVAFNSHRMGLARSFAPYCMARVVWLSVRLSLNHTRHLHGEHRHDGDTALSLLELPPQCCTEMPLGRGKSLE